MIPAALETRQTAGERRLEMGKRLGADETVNVNSEDPVEAVQQITRAKGVQYVLECSGAPNALNEAARMVNRGGRICLAAFPADPMPVDLAYIVRNNIYVFGIRGEGKSATPRPRRDAAEGRADRMAISTCHLLRGAAPRSQGRGHHYGDNWDDSGGEVDPWRYASGQALPQKSDFRRIRPGADRWSASVPHPTAGQRHRCGDRKARSCALSHQPFYSSETFRTGDQVPSGVWLELGMA
jgi:Zinc-binding dehydrogenase